MIIWIEKHPLAEYLQIWNQQLQFFFFSKIMNKAVAVKTWGNNKNLGPEISCNKVGEERIKIYKKTNFLLFFVFSPKNNKKYNNENNCNNVPKLSVPKNMANEFTNSPFPADAPCIQR